MSFQLSLSTDPVTAAYPDEPLLVSPESTVGDVLELLRAERGSSVLVCAGNQVSGIFTERDALHAMASGSDLQQPIANLMTAQPTSIGESASISEAIEKMSQGGYRNLPIVNPQGGPRGMVAVRGVVHYLVDHFPETIYTLPPEPGAAPAEREGA